MNLPSDFCSANAEYAYKSTVRLFFAAIVCIPVFFCKSLAMYTVSLSEIIIASFGFTFFKIFTMSSEFSDGLPFDSKGYTQFKISMSDPL